MAGTGTLPNYTKEQNELADKATMLYLEARPTSKTVTEFGVQYLRPYHREIARRLVVGQKSIDICKDMNITPARLSIITNTPLFKLELRRLELQREQGVVDVMRTLTELSPLALEVVERTMYQSPSEKMRMKAAESILDRAGFGAINKNLVRVDDASSPRGQFSDAEIQRLIVERVEAMKREATQRAAEMEEAETIELEPAEGADGCSTPEQSPLTQGMLDAD